MEEVIVTTTQWQTLIDMPRYVSVVSSIDIERSGAASIPDLLARYANISVSSFAGNGKFSKVDLRGSGDTSASNVLVLIDGIKINIPDLSGADFATLPLNQIERIEIVRGGNSVRYGGGAAQGVINIVTQRAPVGSQLQLGAHSETNDTFSSFISAARVGERQGIALHLNHNESEGYRQHNNLEADNLLANYRLEWSDKLNLSLKARLYRDDWQLPGPLTLTELANHGRKASIQAKRERGELEDDSYLATLNWQPAKVLEISQTIQYRERVSDFESLASIADDTDRIKLRSVNYNAALHWQAIPDWLTLSSGFEKIDERFTRTEGGYQPEVGRITNKGEIDSDAVYLYLQSQLSQSLGFQGGYRKQSTDTLFDRSQLARDLASADCTIVIDPVFGPVPLPDSCPVFINTLEERDLRWRDEAYEAGLSQELPGNWRAYLSAAKTFRQPNVDELVESPPDLRPQHSERYELGIKFNRDLIEGSLNLFRSRTTDEIIYRPHPVSSVEQNLNYPTPIRREGAELALHLYPVQDLVIDLEAGYVHARARDEDNRYVRIPLVPAWTAALHLGWSPGDWQMDFYLRHVDERLDGNDFNNSDFDSGSFKLKSHTLSDLRIARNIGHHLQLYAGVNNLGNDLYFSTAYSQTVYPANERSFYGGFRASL